MSLDIGSTNLDEIDFVSKMTFFQNPDYLGICISELSSNEPNNNTIFLLKVVTYWIDQKWPEIEGAFSSHLHTLLFQVLPEKYATFNSDMQKCFAQAQSSLYIKIWQAMPDFWEWLLAQPPNLVSNFIIFYSKNLLNLSPLYLDVSTALKDSFNVSGVSVNIGNFALSLFATNPQLCFDITDSIAPITEPSWIVAPNNLQIIHSWLQNPEQLRHALILIESAIQHTEMANRNSLFEQLLGIENLNGALHALHDVNCIVQAANFMYNLYNLINQEERAPIIECAKGLITDFPITAYRLLRILAADPLTTGEPEAAFSTAWVSLLGMAHFLEIEHIDNFFEGEKYVGAIFIAVYDSDKEKMTALINEIFSEIDPINNPQQTLAQISLLRQGRHRGVKFPNENQICASFVELCSADPSAIAGSTAATCALLNLFKYAESNQMHFSRHRETLVSTYISFILESGATPEILRPFEEFLPTFLQSYGAFFQWTPEILLAIIEGLNPLHVQAAAVALLKYQKNLEEAAANELKLGIFSEIEGVIDESDPIPGVIALLTFTLYSNGIGAEQAIQIALQFSEVDEVERLVVLCLRFASENIFDDVHSRAVNVTGPKTTIACFEAIQYIVKNKTKYSVTNEDLSSFLVAALGELLSQAQDIVTMSLADFFDDTIVIDLMRAIELAFGASFSYLPPEFVSETASWILPHVVSEFHRPLVFAAMRKTAETLVFKAKEFSGPFMHASFVFILCPLFDPHSQMFMEIIDDALDGVRKCKNRVIEQFHAEVAEAAQALGLTQEETQELVEICGLRSKQALERAQILFQEYWKHSAPVY